MKPMISSLLNWESKFRRELVKIDMATRQKAGALLPVIPNHYEWDDFLGTVRSEWVIWRDDLTRHGPCLVVLYGGVAFYEYEGGTFWPHFAKAVGSDPLSANQQGDINQAFANAAENLGLRVQCRERWYVGSAVYHIGIPLSLWDGFLEVCEWALRRDDWNTLSDDEWANSVGKRVGGRLRLKTFLIDNREAAAQCIQEMHDARKILSEDASLTIDELSRACLLKQEYFEEVPETAEFLRPQDPDSLFRYPARLVWNEQRRRISLQLPAVAREKLPAKWSVVGLSQEAATTPDELVLDSASFVDSLVLNLESDQKSPPQRLQGLMPWGLFDLEHGGRLVNHKRQQLPIRGYVLLSPDRLDNISRTGFDEEENPANECYELSDGITCYLTRLWPKGTKKTAELSFVQEGISTRISFRSSTRVEIQLFMGESSHAANFARFRDWIKIERLPLLCAAIPIDYYKDTGAVLRDKFHVYVDDMPTDGRWEKRHTDDDMEYYFWCWDERPVSKDIEHKTLRDFSQLRPDDFEPIDLSGKRIISLKAPGFGDKSYVYQIEIMKPKPCMDKCWENLPGAFLPWFVLSQSDSGMKWDDLMLAKDAIAPQSRISYYLLRKYADCGLLVQQGRKWKIGESRAVLGSSASGACEMRYCGDPSILWRLFRRIYDLMPDSPLPTIEVMDRRGEMPFLQMTWMLNQWSEIDKYLRRHGVRVVGSLWERGD